MSISRKEQLTDKQLLILESEMALCRKDTGRAYTLWLIGGSLGLHHFYLEKAFLGVLYLLVGAVGWFSIITSGGVAVLFGASRGVRLGFVGLFCIVLLIILLGIDLFTLPKQVKESNMNMENNIINEILSDAAWKASHPPISK